MKKVLSVVVLLLLVGAGFGAWYVMKPGSSGSEVAPQSILPADTLAMVTLTDAATQIDEFKKSPLGKAIESIDLGAVLTKLEAPPHVTGGLDQYRSEFSSRWNTAIFNALFGQSATIAMLPAGMDAFAGEMPDPEVLLGGLVIVAKPTQDAAMLSFLSQWIPDVESQELEAYQGTAIRVLKFKNGRQMFTATSGDLLVGTFGLDALKATIDTATGAKPSLAENVAFQNTEKPLGSEHRVVFVYGDIAQSFGLLESRLKPFMKDPEDIKAWEQMSGFLKGWGQLGYAGFDDGSTLLLDKARLNFDRNTLDPAQLALFELPPEESAALRMAPPETDLFAWDTGFDLKYTVESRLGDPETVKSVSEMFEMQAGMPLQAVYDAVGHEVAVIMTDVNTRGMFPVPNFSILLEAKDRAVLDQLMDKLIEQAGASMQTQFAKETEEVDGVVISQVMVPFGADIRPSWAVIDQYYVIAVNPDIIKGMIAAKSSGTNLVADEMFKSVDNGLSGVNKSVSYVRFDRLMGSVLDLAKWGQAMSSMGDPDAAVKAEIAIKELLEPMIKGLQMYKASGSHAIVKNDVVSSQTYTRIDRGEK